MKKLFKNIIYSLISVDDIHALLAKRRHIALIWSTDDVRSYNNITEDEAWEILQRCKALDDGSHGITFNLIDEFILKMFPHRD